MSVENSVLPPGWEARYDFKMGKTYYINHVEKITTWDHPAKNKKSNSSKTQHSKHANGSSKHHSNINVDCIPLQELSHKTRGSPLSVRSKVQDTSLTNTVDTDQAVSKLSAMFPTVSDAHIRLLMKNYRYMKSIFPQAEETIILDVLSNNENNIQKTSEKLREMGFDKKDSVKIAQQAAKAKAIETAKTPPPKSPLKVKIKSAEEKAKLKLELQKEHHDVPEQLITMALESVAFDREKASNLLKDTTDNAVKVQEGKIVISPEVENEKAQENNQTKMAISQSRQSLKSLLKADKAEKENIIFNRVIEESNSGYKSGYLSNTTGANPTFAKGNNEKLLLEDYVKWQGPNPNHHVGPRNTLAKGPNPSYKLERKRLSYGPNADFHKGPNKSLVKGSIFQQMKVAVSVGGGECRGK